MPVVGTDIRAGFDVVKHRVKLLDKWLAVAQVRNKIYAKDRMLLWLLNLIFPSWLEDNNNFNAVMEILAALDSAPVRKQKAVWESISKKVLILFNIWSSYVSLINVWWL